MARRKADWSLIQAQMKARDSVDRQGRFRDRIAGQQAGLLGVGSVPKPVSRPSDYQQRRASGQPSRGYTLGHRGGGMVTSAEATYSYPDAASISNRPSNTERQYIHSFRVPGATQDSRAAATVAPVHDPYARESSVQSVLPEMAKVQRQASTQAAYRAADASMYNSNVTPKAAPLKEYQPRGKTVRARRKSTGTNIQAFY